MPARGPNGGIGGHLRAYCLEHGLAPLAKAALDEVYHPLANAIETWRPLRRDAIVVGISGSIGSGKTILAGILELLLGDRGLRVARVSIDDFYKTHAERLELARSVHPLLAQRVAPGTHDLPLALNTLGRLRDLGAGQTLALPRFDKSVDDRVVVEEWPRVTGPLDVVLFEGWFLRTNHLADAELFEPLNRLEVEQDSTMAWRRYVSERLSDYAPVFAFIDRLIYIQTEDMAQIVANTLEQDRTIKHQRPGHRLLESGAMLRFVQQTERITRRLATTTRKSADIVLRVDEGRRYRRV